MKAIHAMQMMQTGILMCIMAILTGRGWAGLSIGLVGILWMVAGSLEYAMVLFSKNDGRR